MATQDPKFTFALICQLVDCLDQLHRDHLHLIDDRIDGLRGVDLLNVVLLQELAGMGVDACYQLQQVLAEVVVA